MAIKLIRNFDELKAAMTAYVMRSKRKQRTVVDDNKVLWFVAVKEAETIFESYRVKDLASELIEGRKPIDRAYVDTWLLTFLEDNVNMETGEILDGEDNFLPDWDVWFKDFFGC